MLTSEPLVYPMLAMVLLTLSVLLRLFLLRSRLATEGEIDPQYFQTYQTGREPADSAKLARHFSNLFEAPTLFYVACLLGIQLEIQGKTFLVLAWLYVVSRIAHAYIHTGRNSLRPRIAAYFASWAVLLCMWGRIVVA